MKEIKLSSRKYPNLVALVDDEDYDELINLWHIPFCTFHILLSRIINKGLYFTEGILYECKD